MPVAKTTIYKNCIIARLKNRRITLVPSNEDSTYHLEFKKLLQDKEDANIPHASHINVKDKIVKTSLKLSEEALFRLALIILNHLLMQKKIVFNVNTETKKIEIEPLIEFDK